MLKPFACLGLMALLTSCNNQPQIENFVPVIGLNKAGKSDVKLVPTAVFNKEMTPFISDMADEVSTTLDREESLEEMPWTLSRVTVGLALEAEFEVLEDVLEAEGHGDIELRFQKVN